ncbi:hypothetical protein NL676_026817 [Syzygium grande]|nr:hypothetical protein NL676_026817 [Syzygium grande]
MGASSWITPMSLLAFMTLSLASPRISSTSPHENKIKNTNLKPSHGYIPKVPGTPLLEGMNIDGAERLEVCEKFTSLMWPSGNDHFWYNFFSLFKPADLDANMNPIAHTDKSFLSYLHQNNIRGLEVRTKDGMIETPKEFIDEAHPQQYKPFNHIDFLCYYDSSDNRIKAESLIKTYCRVRAN